MLERSIEKKSQYYFYENRESFRAMAKTDNAMKAQEIIAELTRKGTSYRIEHLHNGNGEDKLFIVPIENAPRTRPIGADRQRCKYCGCLVSNFDIHCSSCGAPI